MTDDDLTPEALDDRCTCPWVDSKFWTTHFGAVEPGSTQEYDPTCPVHGALRERAERAEAERDVLRATVERVEALVDRWEQKRPTYGPSMFADQLRAALHPQDHVERSHSDEHARQIPREVSDGDRPREGHTHAHGGPISHREEP